MLRKPRRVDRNAKGVGTQVLKADEMKNRKEFVGVQWSGMVRENMGDENEVEDMLMRHWLRDCRCSCTFTCYIGGKWFKATISTSQLYKDFPLRVNLPGFHREEKKEGKDGWMIVLAFSACRKKFPRTNQSVSSKAFKFMRM